MWSVRMTFIIDSVWLTPKFFQATRFRWQAILGSLRHTQFTLFFSYDFLCNSLQTLSTREVFIHTKRSCEQKIKNYGGFYPENFIFPCILKWNWPMWHYFMYCVALISYCETFFTTHNDLSMPTSHSYEVWFWKFLVL